MDVVIQEIPTNSINIVFVFAFLSHILEEIITIITDPAFNGKLLRNQ